MSKSIKVGEIEIQELESGLEAPSLSRDFDVEGSWNTLVQELIIDHEEYHCTRYKVLNEGDGLFAVWRVQ